MTTAAALGLWLVAAVAFVALGGLQLAPPPQPQLVLAALVVLLLGLHGRHRGRGAGAAFP